MLSHRRVKKARLQQQDDQGLLQSGTALCANPFAGCAEISSEAVQKYCLALLANHISHSSVNQTIRAIHFYANYVLNKPVNEIQYIRPKKQHTLPNVLSENEVIKLLKSVTNIKHKAVLYLTYSPGLRVSGVVRLRMTDLDTER